MMKGLSEILGVSKTFSLTTVEYIQVDRLGQNIKQAGSRHGQKKS